MIPREDVWEILRGYDRQRISLATMCSHSALQIFHGARLEGFRTIGICTQDRVETYSAFPLARPDEFIVVDRFSSILNPGPQDELRSKNAIIIPHGSFVEYVGAGKIINNLRVPMYGNRMSLVWETDRRKQREWLESSKLVVPKEIPSPSKIAGKVFVKFHGARGGKGFLTARSPQEFRRRMKEMLKRGKIQAKDAEDFSIQEFVVGVRYYLHFFLSITEDIGLNVGEGRLELLGIDKRVEPIDESYRGLPDVPSEFFDYTVTGNQPVILRESLLPEVMDMGRRVVEVSRKLFEPGLIGPFCLETIYHPDKGFKVFEVSARIVAGTNLYPLGSPYSCYVFEQPMSTGRRIALDVRKAMRMGRLHEIIY